MFRRWINLGRNLCSTYKLALAALWMLLLPFVQGCGAVSGTNLPLAGISPTRGFLLVGSGMSFSAGEISAAVPCAWSSSDTEVLVSFGNGSFRARAPGFANVTAQCSAGMTVTAPVTVTATAPGPIVITHGGTYSGTWASDDPNVPAVNILTNERVVLKNATITGRGDLIDINGTGAGANVTVRDVTGAALDPGVAGLQRGSFISANGVATLRVKHCSMYGVSFGVKVLSSTVSALSITQDLASELEDRASDGNGGFETSRPNLGHFIFLYETSAPAGAEIGWNQVVNTIGSSSTEDVINIFKSQGSADAPIVVHDNYMEGYSSSTTPSYSGAGLIADGDGTVPVTAFVTFEANQMVHTAGSGVEIAVGHDITARKNRVVSCGVGASGDWFAMPFVNAAILWNYYEAPDFYNNTIEGTMGGMLRPSLTDQAEIADLWDRSSDLNATDSVAGNEFSDPCLVNGQINVQAETAERAFWANKLATAGIVPGDRSSP